MNVLVTGAKGYIGRYTTKLLLENGHTVIDYYRGSSSSSNENKNFISVHGESYDIPRMIHVFKKHKIDAIIHLAAQSSPFVSIEVPFETFEGNLRSTVAILEAAKICDIKKVVLFSSECAYGDHGYNDITLDTPLIPETVYGVTKAATEMLGRVYNWRYDMNCVSIRCSKVYGGKQLTPNLLKDMLTAAAIGEKFIAESGGDHYVSLVHADDIANITYEATIMDPSKINHMAVYNACSHGTYWKDALAIIKEIEPSFEYDIGPGLEVKNNFTLESQGKWDMTDTINDLNFKPNFTLREGINAYYEFIKSELD